MTIRKRRTIIEVARQGSPGASGHSTALVSATEPTNAASGDVWFQPSSGEFKILHNGQWKEIQGTIPTAVAQQIISMQSSLNTVIAEVEMVKDGWFDPEDYGAIRGRGQTAQQRQLNTDAINLAAQDAADFKFTSDPVTHVNSVGVLVMRGEYEVMAGVVINCNVDAAQCTLVTILPQTGDPPVIRVNSDPLGRFENYSLRMPKVRPASAEEARLSGVIAIDIRNAYACDIYIPEAGYHGIGLRLSASGPNGCVSNTITLGSLYDNVINVALIAMGAESWVNENKFFGGHFVVAVKRGVRVPGTRHIQMWSGNANSINNNIFYAPNLEGVGPEYHVEIINGQWNAIHDARWEVTDGNFAYVRMISHSGNPSRFNAIHHGYKSFNVRLVEDELATNNYVFNYSSIVHGGLAAMHPFAEVGTIVGRYRVNDGEGTFLGYVPIYDNVT